MRKILTALAVLALFIAFPRTLHAQPLANRTPPDSFVYFGWKGTATPDNGYKGSHLQAVLEASNLRGMMEQLIPQVMQLTEKNNPDDAAEMRAVFDIAAMMLKHPTAAFLRWAPDAKSDPQFGLICHAGADAKLIATKMNELRDRAQKPDEDLRIVEAGEFIAFTAGYSEADANALIAARPPERALATLPAFLNATKHALAPNAAGGNAPSASPFVTFYANAQAAAAAMAAANKNDPNFTRFIEVSGLDGLHRWLITASFDGPNWASSSVIDAPAPRRGLLKLFEGRPVEPALLKQIPASAGSAQIFRFDFAALAGEIRNIVASISPEEGAANFDRAMGAGQMYLGANPIDDILAPLGDTWIVYTDEALAGNGTAGNVLINKLDDPERAKRGVGALWRAAQNFIAPRAAAMGVQLVDEKVGDASVSIIRTPQVSLAFTVNNGYFVLARDGATVIKASTNTPASGLDQNEAFKKLTQQLAGSNAITSFRYMDLPRTAAAKDEELRAGWAAVQNMAAEQGLNLPANLLPPLDRVTPHLAPAAEMSWTTDAGFFSRAAQPFPGADLYSGAPNSPLLQTGGTAMAVSILLPSLNRARETANRVKCASNERQIGQAILLYSNDNQGNYPPDLGTLILTQDITPEVFTCPGSDTALPQNLGAMTPQQIADWVNQNSDYVYMGAGLKNDTPGEQVVLFEKIEDHNHDGLNCLFGDGHVEFVLPTSEPIQQVEAFQQKNPQQKGK